MIQENRQIDTCSRGAIGELEVSVALMEQGWYVFRNLSPTGPIDLVAWRDGEAMFLQVKTGKGNFPHQCKAEYEGKASHMVYLDSDTGNIQFQRISPGYLDSKTGNVLFERSRSCGQWSHECGGIPEEPEGPDRPADIRG